MGSLKIETTKLYKMPKAYMIWRNFSFCSFGQHHIMYFFNISDVALLVLVRKRTSVNYIFTIKTDSAESAE